MLSEASQDFVVGLLVGEGYELVAQDGEYDLLVRRRHALGARPAGVPLDVWAHVLDECTEGRYVAAARILEGCVNIEGVLAERAVCLCNAAVETFHHESPSALDVERGIRHGFGAVMSAPRSVHAWFALDVAVSLAPGTVVFHEVRAARDRILEFPGMWNSERLVSWCGRVLCNRALRQNFALGYRHRQVAALHALAAHYFRCPDSVLEYAQ